MRTKAIHVRVFLEGLEVEFNSVQLTESRNEPPTASISFPADSKVLHILPRTICHVFWLDDGDAGHGTLDATYRLIFQGELTGTSITFDESRRHIVLSFLGFTQNWYNNYIQSLDVNLPNMITAAAMGIDYPTEDRKVQWDSKSGAFMANSAFSPLAGIGSKISDSNVTLPKALLDMIESFGAEGVYLRSMSQAFDIYSQICAFDSTTIKEVTKNQATGGFINSIASNVDSTMTMHDGIMSVIRWIGYEYQENAAPTIIKDKLYRIFMRPLCDFFPPIKCNAVFDDEIQHLTFDRNIDNEPTRLINQTYPFQGVQESKVAAMAMAVVVPAGVYISKEVEEASKIAEKKQTQDEAQQATQATPPSDPAQAAQQSTGASSSSTTSVVAPGSVYYRSLTFDQLKKHIAQAESNSNPAAVGKPNTDGTVDSGLYQINDRHIGYGPKGNDHSVLQKKIDRILAGYGVQPNASKEDKRKVLLNPQVNELVAREVFASQGIDGWATRDKVLLAYSQASGINIIKNDSGILALTPEEQCRGIKLAHRADTTGMENSYILHAVNTAFATSYTDMESAYAALGKDPSKISQVSKLITDMYGPINPGDEQTLQQQATEHIHSYHTAMALIDFYQQRHRYRTCNVSVPYSPYRLVGLPGIILTHYFAPIIGTLHSVSSMISADGNATQNLSFTHARIYATAGVSHDNAPEGELMPTFVPSTPYGFMDDNYPSPPFWYDDFAKGEGLNDLYYQMTGRSKTDKDNTGGVALWYPDTVADYNNFATAANKLYSDYKRSKTAGNSHSFVHKHTRRELPTRADVSKHWITGVRKLLPVSARGIDAKPFVKDRIDRVKEVFDYKGTNLSKDIFVDRPMFDGVVSGTRTSGA